MHKIGTVSYLLGNLETQFLGNLLALCVQHHFVNILALKAGNAGTLGNLNVLGDLNWHLHTLLLLHMSALGFLIIAIALIIAVLRKENYVFLNNINNMTEIPPCTHHGTSPHIWSHMSAWFP